MKQIVYRVMQIDDYLEAMDLWRRSSGIRLRGADSVEATERYLLRNPGLSFIAAADLRLVGTIMGGHDGRRGYIQHLAVDEPFRNRGIASHLVSICVEALRREGIAKSHIFVLRENELAIKFWERRGWIIRQDISTLSFSKLVDKDI